MIDSEPCAKFFVKSLDVEDCDNKDNSITYETVYSSGTGVYKSGNISGNNEPRQFVGFQGSPPLTAEQHREQFLALRSILHKNDFIKMKQPDSEQILFVPQLATSEQNNDPRWCVALCGEDEDSPTFDTFVVYTVGPDGKPEKESKRVKILEGSNGPLTIKMQSIDDDDNYRAIFDENSWFSGGR